MTITKRKLDTLLLVLIAAMGAWMVFNFPWNSAEEGYVHRNRISGRVCSFKFSRGSLLIVFCHGEKLPLGLHYNDSMRTDLSETILVGDSLQVDEPIVTLFQNGETFKFTRLK